MSNEMHQLECTRVTGRRKTGDSGPIPSGIGRGDYLPPGDHVGPV